MCDHRATQTDTEAETEPEASASASAPAPASAAGELASIGRLAAGVAHEINTPAQFVGDNLAFVGQSIGDLLTIIAAAERLARAAPTGVGIDDAVAGYRAAVEDGDLAFLIEQLPAAVDQSQDGMRRISRIVRAMGDLAHPARETMAPVDLNRLVDSAVAVAANEWRKVADVDLRLAEDLPPVRGQAGPLGQAVLNLVVNAAHAIADVFEPGRRGCITVTTSTDGDHSVITVADTGAGIPPEIGDRVFEPFFTTKEVGRGTGQGLALAWSVIVQAHGGELGFETERGRGTTFTVRLPLAADRRRHGDATRATDMSGDPRHSGSC